MSVPAECEVIRETPTASEGFLMCDLDEGHDGRHHDPVDGEWA